ncbi:MAG: type 4a pilus biogenesis protein PilO [Candidatus Paceibacterota bacterium]
MNQYIIPVVILAATVGVFLGFTDPLYQEIKQIQNQSTQLRDALENTKTIQEVRDRLLARFNDIEKSDLDRLERMLPGKIDNVRLILEIDEVASRHGMLVKDIGVLKQNADEDSIGPDVKPYGSLDLAFTITGSYDSFRAFLSELEQSLRVIDIRAILFIANTSETIHEYSITVRAYWLR